MYTANKAVHAWNWTTGKTKVELANTMSGMALALEGVGFSQHGWATAGFVIPLLALNSFQNFSINKRIGKAEERAKEKEGLDPYAEHMKQFYKKTLGPLWLGASTFQALPPRTPYASSFIVAGHAMRAGQFYVMRADSLPPRKNCVKRGIEWGKKKLEDLADAVRTPVPQPVTVGDRKYFERYMKGY